MPFAYAQSDFILPPFDTCKPYDGLVDNKDGTLTDPRNGLVWSRCDLGTNFIKGKGCLGKEQKYSWIDAMKMARQLSASTSKGWRLPTRDEIKLISDSYSHCTRYGSYQPAKAAAVDLRMLTQEYYDTHHKILTLGVFHANAWGGSDRVIAESLRTGYESMNDTGEEITSKSGSGVFVRLVHLSGSEQDSNLLKAQAEYATYIDEPERMANQERLNRNAEYNAKKAADKAARMKIDSAKQ